MPSTSSPSEIQPQDSVFLQLPEEVLVQIANQLPQKDLCQLGSTCHKLNSIAKSAKESLRTFCLKLDRETWEAILKRRNPSWFQYTRRLELSRGANNFSPDDQWEKFFAAFPALQELVMSNISGLVTDAVIQALAQSCPNLQKLDLSFCREITDSAIQTLAQSCPSLQSLHLHGCEKITDQAIQALAEHCHGLLEVNLERCELVTPSAIQHLSKHCPKLQTLKLPCWDSATAAALVQNCSNFQSLTLSACPGLTDAAVQDLVQKHPKLRELRLTHFSMRDLITKNIFTILAEHCSNLQSLTLQIYNSFSVARMLKLLKRCSHLQALDMYCYSNSGTLKLDKLPFPELRSLTLAYGTGSLILPRDCPNLRDITLSCEKTNAVTLPENCPGLQRLSVSPGERKYEDHTLSLVMPKNFPGLRELHLEKCNLSEARFREFIEHCPELQKIELVSCCNVSNFTATRNCSNLQYLELRGGETKAVRLPRNCTSLQSLYLDSDDLTAVTLPEHCPNLRDMTVRNCFDEAGRISINLPQDCPRLESLHLEGLAADTLLPQHCPKLQNMTLQGHKVPSLTLPRDCPELSLFEAGGIRVLNLYQNYPRLEILYIDAYDKGEDPLEILLIDGCYPRLRELDLLAAEKIKALCLTGQCPRLESINFPPTLETIIVSSPCPGIKSLDLSESSRLTDDTVIALLSQCPNLTKLNLSDCPKLTDAVLHVVGKEGTKLKKLFVKGCPRLSDAAIRFLESLRPALKIIRSQKDYEQEKPSEEEGEESFEGNN